MEQVKRKTFIVTSKKKTEISCIKSIGIRSFSGSYFPAFGFGFFWILPLQYKASNSLCLLVFCTYNNIYIYMYLYMCVCVCVCVCKFESLLGMKYSWIQKQIIFEISCYFWLNVLQGLTCVRMLTLVSLYNKNWGLS